MSNYVDTLDWESAETMYIQSDVSGSDGRQFDVVVDVKTS